jgi:hypothetical protein
MVVDGGGAAVRLALYPLIAEKRLLAAFKLPNLPCPTLKAKKLLRCRLRGF